MDCRKRARERASIMDPASPEARAAMVRERERLGFLPPRDPKAQRERLMRLLEAARKAEEQSSMARWQWPEGSPERAEAQEECLRLDGLNDLNWAEDYASSYDGSHGDYGVLIANWNYDWLKRWSKLMEKLPLGERVACDWSDCYSTCGDCNKAVQTEPDCHSWEPQYAVYGSDVHCRACAVEDPEEVREAIEREHGGKYAEREIARLPQWLRDAMQEFSVEGED